MYKEIGDNIKKMRTVKALTQKELAEKAGIAQSFLSDIERGNKSPTIRTSKKIALALGINLKELIS